MNESITQLQNIWTKVMEDLKKNIEDSRMFDAFLSESSIVSIDNGTVLVAVNSNLAVTILQNKYVHVIQNSIKNVLGEDLKVEFSTKADLKEKKIEEVQKPTHFKNSTINPSFTFDNFVTGPSNLEAKQAALFIASNPVKGYNPLYIYSNPGLGKTHLLHAIVNYLRETNPGKKALYCTSDNFMDEFVDFATGVNREDDLKKFILDFDILLIDDIQYLGTRESTAKFFFDIFNNMYARNKQVVITSDKHPTELKYFDERFKSRFSSGLTVTIDKPDTDTCVSVLKSKIENSLIDINSIDSSVLDFIASYFSQSIRYIDEAFNKLLWYVTSFRPAKHITLEIAKEALQPLLDVREAKSLNEQRIISAVADYYNLSASQLTGPSRQGTVVLARHISMYLIRYMLDTSFTKIGLIFGGKDHSTVMSGVEKVENSIKTNTALETAINDIKKQLKS